MRAILSAFLALALCALPAPRAAADAARAPADSVRVMGLEECVRLGLANDAGLRSDELQTRIDEARIHEMQAQYLPSLSLQGGYSRLSDVAPGTMSASFGPLGTQTITFPPTLDNSTSVSLSLQQPLFTGRRIASSVRQAEALRDSARGDLASGRLDLRYTITEEFWNLAKARNQVKTIEQSVVQAQTHLADAQKLLDQGMATTNDVLQARMRLEDANIALASARSAREIARTRLAVLVGLPWSANIDVPDSALAPVEPPRETLSDLVGKALASRPELQAARSRVSAQEAGVDLARAGLFPNVFVTGNYTLANPNPRVFPQSDQFIGTWSVGIMASIDLGRYPQVLAQEQQARNRVTQAEESAHRLSDAVTTDVVRAYLALTEAVSRYASLHQETAQAEENDRVTQERYREGVALSSESLDAQAMLVRARLAEDSALFDCEVARAALDRAVGAQE